MNTSTEPGPVEADILKKLQAFEAQHLQLENESYMHNVPPGSESHFKLTLVCDEFQGVSKVRRHQQVYGVLAEEMAGPVHALALHVFSPEEWQQQNVPASPQCLGGSNSDKS